MWDVGTLCLRALLTVLQSLGCVTGSGWVPVGSCAWPAARDMGDGLMEQGYHCACV